MSTAARDRMPPGRRRQLVLAAAREFAEHGFDHASLNRIIASCRMSKSSLYHVVDSKADLVDLVVGDLVAALAEQWRPPEPAAFTDDFWSVAETMLTELGRQWQATPEFGLLGRVFYLNADGLAGNAFFATVIRWLREVLEVGRAHGGVRTDLPADLQADVTWAVLRTFDEWTMARAGELSGGELIMLADQQLNALRRLLA